MEDTEQLQAIPFNPVESIELLTRIHHEPRRALSLIAHKDHLLCLVAFPGEKAAGFLWRVPAHIHQHFLPLRRSNP